MLSPLGLESLGFESRPHSGRLSGLLSGCPPTGTRPQARAKLGGRDISALSNRCKSFLPSREIFRAGESEMVTRALSSRLSSASRGGSARGAERCRIVRGAPARCLRAPAPRAMASARALACCSRDAIIADSIARTPFHTGQYGRRRTLGRPRASAAVAGSHSSHHLQMRRSAMPELETNRRPIASRSAEWAQGLGGVSCPNQRDAQSDLGGERPFRRGRRGVAGVQAHAIGLIGCAAAFRPGSSAISSTAWWRSRAARNRRSGRYTTSFPTVSPIPSHRRLGYAVGWPALGWFGALAAALTAYVRVFGGSLGFARIFAGPWPSSSAWPS